MTKLDAGLITPLPASGSGSAAVWGSKKINPRPQFCLCLTWSGCPSNDDDDELKSSTVVQRKFRNEFGQDPPRTNSIAKWFKNFMETGSILDRKRLGIDEETVDAVRVAFHRSPRKSIRVASNELAIPRSTVQKALHKRLRLHAYKLQLFKLSSRMITLAEQLLLKKFFSALMMTMILNSVVFSDEAIFNAVSVRRVLSKLISKFTLYCSW